MRPISDSVGLCFVIRDSSPSFDCRLSFSVFETPLDLVEPEKAAANRNSVFTAPLNDSRKTD